MNGQRQRSPRGQSVIVLGLLIAFFVLLAVGLFSFEVSRIEAARLQLRSACEAAALAGAATLASQDDTDAAQAQTAAMATAVTAFRQNSVAGVSLAEAIQTYTNPDDPPSNQSSLFIEFLNPHDKNRAVSLGDARGKIVRATGNFGYTPAFGSFLNLSNATLHATSHGGVPQMDIVLCFDVSASIDDQTPVSFVRRAWNSQTNRIEYTIPPTRNGAPAGAKANGRIYDVIGPPATGSALDGLPPQTLQASNQSDHRYKLDFSEVSGRTGAAKGLRGANEAGSPPGNYSGSSGIGSTYTYTDLVVNLDGALQFTGTTSGGYAFPNVATLVEASRGNLEDANVFASSKANTGVPAEIRPAAGYRAEYRRLAAAQLRPLRDAQEACQTFLTIMNTNTDAHFGLVAFTTNAGTSSTSTVPMSNVDANYTPGGNGNFLNPRLDLNNGTAVTNYQQCYDMLARTVPISGTNIGDAVYQASEQLRRNGRPGAKKAIIVFTDGQPTSGGPLNADPWVNARLSAQEAKKIGAQIYTVGLAQNPEIVTGEVAILNDTNASPSAGGIAAIAGNGGKFFLVTSVSDLRATFENIARHLVQLVD